MDQLIIKGAREHNLKNVFLEIPKGKLVVFTGVSGSGKSSLAFDTIYAEGQRRYVESLSAYARQFLGQMEKPHYDWIKGLSPTISIEQKATVKNPRSTVGTVTEIYDYLRVLYARIGLQHCPICSEAVGRQTAEQMVRFIQSWKLGTKFIILAPRVANRKGEYKEVFMEAERDGFSRVRVNGQIRGLEERIDLDKKLKHNIEIVIDRLVLKESMTNRLTDSVEMALSKGEGSMLIHLVEEQRDIIFSEKLACTRCNRSFSELSPQSFSFNSPLGMCVECNGLGTRFTVDETTFIQDPKLSISKGAVIPWAAAMKRKKGWTYRVIMSILSQLNVNPDMPFEELEEIQKNYIFYGSAEKNRAMLGESTRSGHQRHHFRGLVNSYLSRIEESAEESTQLRESHSKHVRNINCPECLGSRLKPDSRAVLIQGHDLPSICSMTIKEAYRIMSQLALTGNDLIIAEEILKEIRNRLQFLCSVGLEYLTLSRLAPTLSGGESQRIRLASQIGSELTGVLYILDEPSIGLHQRDNHRLIKTLAHLRDIGNSVIVVEHDSDTIKAADHIVDFGPAAGKFGGNIVFSGSFENLMNCQDSLTAKYLKGDLRVLPDRSKLPPGDRFLEIKGAVENNLKNIDVRIPVGRFISITGVSGAGKSSLINSILWPAAQKHFHRSSCLVGKHSSLTGWQHFDHVIDVNQQPIGRTPRSNPATYAKVFDHIRNLFAALEESKMYGYKPGRFSFNVKGGRCESCQGAGVIRVEMHFLADVFVTCEGCKGRRFNEATLRIKYKGYDISQILNLTVDEALEVFASVPTIRRVLKTIQDVGLGYVHLGQPATTLSGGEAQRIKLSRELAKRSTGRTLYLLDEPTTGLHFDDVHKLLVVLNRLVEQGNTVIVIEHNLDVIRCTDYVVDIGPDGGNEGGEVIFQGPVEEIVDEPRSFTGQFLKPYFSTQILEPAEMESMTLQQGE